MGWCCLWGSHCLAPPSRASGRKLEKFTVSVNVAAGSKVTFELTYEELLKRHKGKYEMYLKVQPKQLVKHFEVISCSPAAPAETAGGRVLGRVPGQTSQQGQEHRNPAPTTWLRRRGGITVALATAPGPRGGGWAAPGRSRLGAGPLGATSQSVSVMLLTAYMGILPTSEWKVKGNVLVVESGAPYGR